MKVVFLGSGDIGLPSLQWLSNIPAVDLVGVVTQPDRPAGRGLEVHESVIKRFAAEKGIKVFQPTRLREEGMLDLLAALEPELFVVMAYGQILSKKALAIPRLLPINLHASLLPRHRGASPVHAAILAGDRESGISVMVMDEGLDTGDVLLQKAVPIRRRETGGSLHDRLASLGPVALAETFGLIHSGEIRRKPQDDTLATYAPKIEVSDALIDWNLSAEEVERRIRAYNPWPGAHMFLPAKKGMLRLKIFSAIVCRKTQGQPGAVLATKDQGVLVGCGQGALLLKDVQLEGKRRMTSAELWRGIHFI